MMEHQVLKVGDFAYMMTYQTKYNIVRNAIKEIDPCCLLAQGAPEDEFDAEAHEIARIINCESVPHAIAEAFATVLNNAFIRTDDASVYLSIAEVIHTRLRNTV